MFDFLMFKNILYRKRANFPVFVKEEERARSMLHVKAVYWKR